jgi:hypothetical protein
MSRTGARVLVDRKGRPLPVMFPTEAVCFRFKEVRR